MQKSNPVTPKDYLLLSFLLLCLSWQLCSTFLGIIIFLGARALDIKIRSLLLSGLVIAAVTLLIEIYLFHKEVSFHLLFISGFSKNLMFLKLLTTYGVSFAMYYQVKIMWSYFFGFPVLIAAIIHSINSSNKSFHAKILKQMSRGELLTSTKRINDKRMERKLAKLKDEDFDGILLGISQDSYKPVVMPDHYVNQIVLTLGTTGAGKTVTLQRFFQRAIRKGYPLIIVDAKPTESNTHHVQNLSEKFGRNFYGFNCGNYKNYNPLAHGGYTELKDKIITLKDKWENDYYLTIAEDYLQTTLEILLKTNQKIDFKLVARCLDIGELSNYVRQAKDPILAEKLKTIQHYDKESLAGLQSHFNMLIKSEIGNYLIDHKHSFNLKQIIHENAVCYFALPALKFPSFAKVLGKLVINDIKTVIESLDGSMPIFTIFDEFSIFAGEQVINLVNMGRGKGIHAVFGTQGLTDLGRVDNKLQAQILNCVNNIICHRLNEQESVKSISDWIGTKDCFDVTAQIASNLKGVLGSASKNKAFVIHPEIIKQELGVGDAIYVSKVGGFSVHKFRAKFVSM